MAKTINVIAVIRGSSFRATYETAENELGQAAIAYPAAAAAAVAALAMSCIALHAATH